MLADHKTDHDTEELKTELLGIEAKLGKEQLRNLNGEQDTTEAEHDRVGDCRDPDGGVAEERQGLDEFDESERCGIDTLEVEVLLLESGHVVANDIAHVKRLGAKEEVSDELHTICLTLVSLVLLIDLYVEQLTIARIQ